MCSNGIEGRGGGCWGAVHSWLEVCPLGCLWAAAVRNAGNRTPKPRPPSPDCFFVEKAYHGQLAGAQAVLVTDHTEASLTFELQFTQLPCMIPVQFAPQS